MRYLFHPWVVVLVLITALSRSTAALAVEPSAEDKKLARLLFFEGRAKLNAGDAQSALKAMRAAHAIMGAPTTGLGVAEAQAALGLLVEAQATALEVVRMRVEAPESKAFSNAREAAATLATELAARIPSLSIHVQGVPAGVALSVRMDGTSIPARALTTQWKANPGQHVVEVSASGYETEQCTMTLKEGQELPVDITLAPVVPVASLSRERGSDKRLPEGGLGAQRIAGIVLGGAGVAAFGVGSAFGLVAASRWREAQRDGHCIGTQCDSAGMPLWKDAHDKAALSTGLFAAGGVLLAAGVVVFVTAPKKAAPSASLWIAPCMERGGAGLVAQRVF